MRIAPFQVLAADGAVYHERPHAWHLDVADRLVAADGELIAPTRRVFADAEDPDSVKMATDWWLDLTADWRGGHGGQAGRQPGPRAARD